MILQNINLIHQWQIGLYNHNHGFRDRDQACLPQIAKAQIPNPVPVVQCHLIHITILFSLYVHK